MSPETMNEYWLEVARELIATRNDYNSDVAGQTRWEGRAVAVMIELLRVNGDVDAWERLNNA